MIPITPADFMERFCASWEPTDHHFTGPLIAQQSEGNGSVFHEEGRILAKYAKKHGGHVLEIGSDLGISSRYIREGLDAGTERPYARLFCVDIYHKWDSASYDDLIEQFHTSADNFTPPEPCEWAFIDGDHQYAAVVKDINRCAELGIKRLFFHDTGAHMPRAKHASEGTDARYAVIDKLAADPAWTLYDISTHCGMVYAECK